MTKKYDPSHVTSMHSIALDTSDVTQTYSGPVQITDLKDQLGTKGHLLVVRGDKAYEHILPDTSICNPKFWLYENLIQSERIQTAMDQFPNHKLFDGTGFSSLEALTWHADRIGKDAVIVMAKEYRPDISNKHNVELIHGDLPAEQGYVAKQRQVLKGRKDLIPLHQALYGARSLAPIGNNVVDQLESTGIIPDASFWCIASGSSLYGIGTKIKQLNPEGKLVVVEPQTNPTIPETLDLHDPEAVKRFGRNGLRNYSLDDWVEDGKLNAGVFPMHAAHPSTYLLRSWAKTGYLGFDETLQIPTKEIEDTQERMRSLGYDWTKTSALTLTPAIEMARSGKNALVMTYGKRIPNRTVGLENKK